jgi:hypothetical protein
MAIFVTFFMRSRQRWRLMSLRSPWGRSLIISISSSPHMVAHFWRSKWRTLCLSRDGSCLRLIHHSISRHLSCIFLFFAMTECKNTLTFSSKRVGSLMVRLYIYIYALSNYLQSLINLHVQEIMMLFRMLTRIN